MSFDGFFLHYMTAELRQELLGGRIQKITQPFRQELVLGIRSQRQNYKLLLSAHPVFGRVQLTETDFANPKTPSTFTMVLRKYLQGAVIENIVQIENDRILEISVSNKNEIGDSIRVSLTIEIMGKHSNILLVDKTENRIIEAIKHLGLSQNSYRTILPGSAYIAPPKTQSLNPFQVTDERLFEIVHTEELSMQTLQGLFQGLGRHTAKELAARLSTEPFKAFRCFFQSEMRPNLTQDGFAAVAVSDSQEYFASLSALLDVYYKDKAEKDRVAQQSNELMKRVTSELEKHHKKLTKQLEELTATETAEEFRQKGELLTTYLHQVPNDKSYVWLENYYTGQPIEIDLDIALSPSQNAQRYFKKYQKLKEAVKHLNVLIEDTKESIRYLESVDMLLEQASLSDIGEIREELMMTGYLRCRHREKLGKRRQAERYLATDGQTILLVGRNNLQNDEVSFKLAKKGDLWFHVKDLPGSHVILTGNPSPSDEVKTDAAELAAYFSKARYSNLVQVDMIEARKLHKPNGAKPGFVTYTGQKTLRVTPNEDKIKSMKL